MPSPSRLLLGAVGVTAAAAAPLFLLGALATQIRGDLSLGPEGIGLAVAVFFAASALMGPLVFRHIERIGERTAVLITVGATAAALLGVALAVRTFQGLLAAMTLAGVAQAFGQPAANGLVSRGLRPERQGLAFGIKQAAVPLMALLAGLAVPLIALTYGWRWAYAVAAGAVLLVPFSTARPKAGHQRRKRTGPPSIDAPLFLLAASGASAAAATMTLGAFLVDSLVARSVSPGTAGLVLAAASTTSIVVRLLVGWSMDLRSRDPVPWMIMMMLLGSLGVAALAIAAPLVPVAMAACLAFGAGWGWNGLLDMSVIRLRQGSPAAATSVMLTGYFVGATFGPLGFGYIAGNVGYATAWLLAAIQLLGAAGLAALARRLS